MKIKIKNFQSIADVDFTVEGFTCIVGKNNIGKSAIIRAIDASLTNESGSDYIRLNTKEASVHIQTDGLDMLWNKGSSASYVINGKRYTKLNRAVPEPILEAGYKQIDVGDQKLDTLVVHQFNPIFLLDKGGSVITDVLSRLYKLDVISRADDLCTKELKATRSTLKTREKDLAKAQEELVRFQDFDALKALCDSIEEDQKSTDAMQDEINTLDRYLFELESVAAEIRQLEKLKKVVLPKTDALQLQIDELDRIKDHELQLSDLQDEIKSLEAFIGVKVPLVEMSEEFSEYERIAEWNDESQAIVAELRALQEKVTILNALDDTDLEQAVSLSRELANIITMSEDIRTEAEQCRSYKATVESLENDLRLVTTEFRSIKACPLCERPF